jgi:hypothetical protein
MPSPILPVKEHPFADGSDERDLHNGPVHRAYDLRDLIMQSEHSRATRKKARQGGTHSGGGIRRGFDLAIFVDNPPQRGEHFCRMFELSTGKIVNLCVEVGAGRFCR